METQLNPAPLESQPVDEEELLHRAKAGDAAAFGAVCCRYETPLLRQALSLCGNLALAEDLAQDTLVEGWKCLWRYQGGCRFFTWLCAILLNRYRNTLRRNRRMGSSGARLQEGDEPADPLSFLPASGSGPDELAQQHEQTRAILECIAALPKKHQQVIYLRFFVDDSLEGIAASLGCSLGTVKSRLFHALEKLRGMKTLRSCTDLAQPARQNPNPSPSQTAAPITMFPGARVVWPVLWVACETTLRTILHQL